MGPSRSTFYDDAPSAHFDDAEIVRRMQTICDEFEAYGYRRVGAELRHQGVVVNHKKIRRLMREHGLQPKAGAATWPRPIAITTVRSFPIALAIWSLTVPTSSGWQISPISQSPQASSTWRRFSTPGRVV
jgi:hypothetical protein